MVVACWGWLETSMKHQSVGHEAYQAVAVQHCLWPAWTARSTAEAGLQGPRRGRRTLWGSQEPNPDQQHLAS